MQGFSSEGAGFRAAVNGDILSFLFATSSPRKSMRKVLCWQAGGGPRQRSREMALLATFRIRKEIAGVDDGEMPGPAI